MTWTRWAQSAAVIAGATLAANGCSEGTTYPDVAKSAVTRKGVSPDRVLAMREKYGTIGKYHNEGLAYVYERLKMSNARSLNRQARCRLAEKAARDFHVSVKRLKLPPGTPAEAMIPSICENRSRPTANRTVMIDQGRDSRRRADLSPAAIGYLEQIESLTNTAQSSDELKAGAYQIESGAVSNLDEAEAGEVVGVISVLTSSADYWQANYSAWESEIGSQPPLLYTVNQSFHPGNSSIQTTPVGLRYGWGFREYLRIVRADVIGGIRSRYGYGDALYCTLMACNAYESFVASMREAMI